MLNKLIVMIILIYTYIYICTHRPSHYATHSLHTVLSITYQ